MTVEALSARRPLPDDKNGWSPRQMLIASVDEPMPRGAILLWVDESGQVQMRRSQISNGDELDCLKTGLRTLHDL